MSRLPRTADTDHGHLEFTDSTSGSKSYECDVNIMSSGDDKRLVYWFVSDFAAQQPSTSALQALSQGFSTQQGSGSLALDFVRGGFLDINKGTLVSHDPTSDASGENDVLSYLDPVLNQAVSDKATVYLWGSRYGDGDGSSGIHDVHMNQGSAGRFAEENGTYQDGGIVVERAGGRWEGVFLAFATQTPQTDDSSGDAEGATFAETLGGGDTGSSTVGIEAVKPRGPDGGGGEGERV